MNGLPIDAVLKRVVESAVRDQPVVLRAPPGAGKTTGVPPALMQAGLADTGQILLVQPRRMAARAVARRLAELDRSRVGDKIGYQVRFDKRISKQTQLIAMTTGILLRRLASDPLLEEVQCVLLDEFHERSLEADLALGMLRRIRETFRPELKLVVMSATLDPAPLLAFLGDANAIESEGRAFPVEVIHTPTVLQQPVQQQVADVIPEALGASRGNVLVFLPGVGEIRKANRLLQQQGIADHVEVIELFGDLPAKQQDSVLRESNRRRIVLSTNVAETSLTIPGVTAVIDSGLARVMRFDPRVGLPKLQIEPISRAAADQRAGRAGRVEAGRCYRLWPAAMHRSRRDQELPEIERTDLSAAILILSEWGERDPFDFPWLTPPPREAVDNAIRLLQRLGAVDPDNTITDRGREMLRFPLHPRLARFMVESVRLGVTSSAAMIAALLTERDPFRSGRQNGSSHLLDRLQQLQDLIAADPSVDGNLEAARNVMRVASQIERLVPSGTSGKAVAGSPESLSRALLAAYPDRIARRREPGSDRGVMIGGRGIRAGVQLSAGDSELLLCIDVDSSGGRPEATVRAAIPIEEDWIDEERIRTVDEFAFDDTSQSVVARRRRYIGDLRISEVPVACQPGPEVAEHLFRHAVARLDVVVPSEKSADDSFLQRVRFLCDRMPGLDLPPIDQSSIEETLRELCQTRTSMKQLADAPWRDYLRGRYAYQQLQQIDQHAPVRLKVPSGNLIMLDYASGKPVLKVRIQELFGWEETPRVAGGRVPVQLQLLGPNYRPQQITEDLKNFWASTYPQVRKDLRGRYPKHYWPENPRSAVATPNGLKPRS
ncbi:MAG: ATP-dependent helicase HrpB [Rubripirellula sp.]|nr:ATP-dependent helicase HrpB [Rubripirellula sp.]